MTNQWPGFYHDGCYFIDSLFDRDDVKINHMDKWDMRPDDIVITTYLKSGTHWMINLLSSLYSDVNFLHPTTKKTVRLGVLYEDSSKISGPYADFVEAVKSSLHEMPSPRLFYNHFPYTFLPEAWKERGRRCKFIYIARNPKDVCVSYYHHFKAVPWLGMDLSWEEWVHAFVEGKVLHGGWLDHVLGWKTYGLQDNVLHVTYEDMRSDLKGVLTRIADFLGRPKSDEEIERVAKPTDVAEMRKGDEFYRKYSMAGGNDSFLEGTRYVRKGQVGDWKNHFTVAQNELFDREITEKAKKHGLELVYDT